MKVKTIPFFLYASKRLYFKTIEFIEGQKANHFMVFMNNINTLYQYGVFHITRSNMDDEFEPIRAVLLGFVITLNTLSCDEHVPEDERNVRTVKDQVRSVLTNIPFTKVPDHIIIEIFLGQVFWWNSFPNKYGVSKTMIPRHIMYGLKIDYNNHYRIACGQYVQTHEKHGKNMIECTVVTIAIQPTGNRQGRYYFYITLTGRHLNHRAWTELPIPDEAV